MKMFSNMEKNVVNSATNYIIRGMRKGILVMMQYASRKLNSIDQFQYPRKFLKLIVEMYNDKEIGKSELLKSYINANRNW